MSQLMVTPIGNTHPHLLVPVPPRNPRNTGGSCDQIPWRNFIIRMLSARAGDHDVGGICMALSGIFASAMTEKLSRGQSDSNRLYTTHKTYPKRWNWKTKRLFKCTYDLSQASGRVMSDCCPSSASAQIEGIVLDKPTGTWNTWTAQRRYLSTRVLQLPALDVAILPLFTSYTLVSNCSINTPVHVSSDHFQPGVSSSRRLAAGHIHDQTLPIDKPHHIPHAACLASGTADQSLSSNSGLSTAPTGNMPKGGTYALSTVSHARLHFHGGGGWGEWKTTGNPPLLILEALIFSENQQPF
ncbi:uncharacterized protein TRIREDRAFT_112630 [Trichoderma reesei QM6a]|uniref:Predicted protein n=2 Tax=Hypocrea jecorina TaxID=51453 RepID=G0RXJ8_HYPJQ|nr:uncharacterized protein TRIREDRAFT_112630 [Trichoderma reesei QM6a]EGR44096.1 predicted protein [Trichoderma reesei QM6a]ETR96716.1 hypothetical protein M419DRAFT_135151 [Trichoderma reesei RUT C-30]